MFIEIEETAKEIGHGGLRTLDKMEHFVDTLKALLPYSCGFPGQRP